MRQKTLWSTVVHLLLAMLLVLPFQAMAQSNGGDAAKKISKEELAQLLAPIALYPDDLVAQILMASTYPIEVVQADRWAKSHKQSAGDVLAKQLEKEPWDPSVKSMVNFPSVLSAMSEKLDVTTKIGDAFLSQKKDVMDTIQDLRKKAKAAGNLKTTKEQTVIVEKEVIVIKPADPQVIYVPSYSTTVVYGAWPYPAYPPYYYYPPPPPAYPAYHFAAGVAVGAAWGYAWGNSNWHGGDVDIDVNRNTNINNNIDRSKYQNKVNPNNKGSWQHNPEHRKGAAYRDGATAKQYGQSPSRSQEGRRDASRGYGNAGGSAANRPSAGTMDKGAGGMGSRPSAGTMDKGAGGAGSRPSAGTMDKGAGGAGSRPSAGTMDRGGRESAFSGGGSGSQARAASDRGMSSRQSSGGSSFGGGGGSSRGSSFSGGGGGRGGRGGGGGGRGGGGRR
jgi:hypothetical protein